MRRWAQSLVMVSMLQAPVWANPFVSLPVVPSSETAATGKTLFSLEDGDYVQPLFSPDSRYLAYAREVSEKSAELTEIQALELKNLQVKTLLNSRASREFAFNRGYVAGFAWTNAKTLKAGISDGDVNGVDLVFDVESGRLVEKKPLSISDEAPGEGGQAAEFVAAFPSVPPPVLENALINGFKVGDKKYIVQKNYWKQDNHIWYLDAGRKEMVKFIDIPDTWIYSLRGAFASGDAYILLMAYGQEAYLVRYRGAKLELLYRYPVKNYQQTRMRVEHAQGDRVLLQIVTGADYEKRNNLFFAYDHGQLRRIKDTDAVYDLDVDGAGKLVCFSQWKDGKRRLVLKELKYPR